MGENFITYNSHFVLVKKPHFLLTEAYKQARSHYKKVCKICFMTLSTKETLYKHYLRYHLEENQKPKIDLPMKKDPIVKYDIMNEKDFKKTQCWPFVVYGDFEAFNYRIAGIENVSHQQVPNSYMLFSPDLNSRILTQKLLFATDFLRILTNYSRCSFTILCRYIPCIVDFFIDTRNVQNFHSKNKNDSIMLVSANPASKNSRRIILKFVNTSISSVNS
jgi:hypothetical protein